MFHGATLLAKGDLKLETTENALGVTGFGFVDKQGSKPKSVVATLEIPGCSMATGGVDDSTKALSEAWKIFQEARPGKQISWMLFVDEGPEVVQSTPHGLKRGRDVLALTDDFEARRAKALKTSAPEEPARPEKARDPRSSQSRDVVIAGVDQIRLTREKQPDGAEVWTVPEEDSDEDDEAFLAGAAHYKSLNKD
jgi:hypothetical protein